MGGSINGKVFQSNDAEECCSKIHTFLVHHFTTSLCYVRNNSLRSMHILSIDGHQLARVSINYNISAGERVIIVSVVRRRECEQLNERELIMTANLLLSHFSTIANMYYSYSPPDTDIMPICKQVTGFPRID